MQLSERARAILAAAGEPVPDDDPEPEAEQLVEAAAEVVEAAADVVEAAADDDGGETIVVEAPEQPTPAEVAEATVAVIEAEAAADVERIEAQAEATATVIEAEHEAAADELAAPEPDNPPASDHRWFRPLFGGGRG